MIFFGVEWNLSVISELGRNCLEFNPAISKLQIRFQFEASEAAESSTKEDMREQLLRRLIDNRLLGPHRQVSELCPKDLPVKQLPPGSTSNLFLMYLAFMRQSDQAGSPPASRSTFYSVAKQWSKCLQFRRRCEHAMCAVCQSLKAKIHASTDSQHKIVYFGACPHLTFVLICMLFGPGKKNMLPTPFVHHGKRFST